MFVCGTFVVEKQGCKLSSPVFPLFSEKNLQSWTKLLRQLNKFHVNLHQSLLRQDILVLFPNRCCIICWLHVLQSIFSIISSNIELGEG